MYIPDLKMEPDAPEDMPRCPECGAGCEWLFRDRAGRVVGCETCIDQLLADDHRHLTL